MKKLIEFILLSVLLGLCGLFIPVIKLTEWTQKNNLKTKQQ